MIDLQRFSDNWCNTWNLPKIQIIYADIVGDSRGLYDNVSDSKPVILLDTQFFVYKEHPLVIVSLLHELRHYWQDIHFHNVLDFFEFHEEFYEKYYFEPFVVTEYDARVYSWTFGEMSGICLLREFNDMLYSNSYNMDTAIMRLNGIAEKFGLFRYHDFADNLMKHISDEWKDIWFGRKKVSADHGYSVVEFTWGTAVYDNTKKKWLSAFFRDGSEVILEHSSAVCTDEGILFNEQKQ